MVRFKFLLFYPCLLVSLGAFAQSDFGFGDFLTDKEILEDEFIDITEAIYTRLPIRVVHSYTMKVPGDFKRVFEKNLLWTGIFDLTREPSETGIVLNLGDTLFQGMKLSLFADSRPVYEGFLKVSEDPVENEKNIVLSIDQIVLALTGKKSSLNSAILFVEAGKKKGKNIVISDPNGLRRTTLVSDGNINLFPVFSPSGKAFIYTKLAKAKSQVIRYDLETGREHILAYYRGISTGGDWLNENTIVTSISARGNSDLYLIDTQSGKIVEKLLRWSSIESSPTFANGRQMAFISDRSGSVQIYSMDMKQRKPVRLTYFSNYSAEPKFSNDGNYIAFSANVGRARFQIFVMNKKGKWIRRITNSSRSAEQPNWSPDDRLIIYTQESQTGKNLYLMTLDGKYKRRLDPARPNVSLSQADWYGDFEWELLEKNTYF